jgi:peptidoglycan/xylan/chitin deacetylase (PgdA/CDA1 family)
VTVRSVLRSAAELPAGALARWQLLRQRDHGVLAILAFHNTVQQVTVGAARDRSLHLPIAAFRDLIDALAALPSLRFVPLTALRGAATTEGVSVAITFDDAYRGALRHALPHLASRGIAATVFVAPALLGVPSLWWDDLAQGFLANQEAQWMHARDSILRPPIAGRGALVPMSVFNAVNRAPAPDPDYGIASLEELRDACALGSVTLGCHSWSHACLPSLSDEELRTELVRSRQWLEESGMPWVPMHAFPYGRWSEREVTLLKQQGFTCAFRVDGGSVRCGDQVPFCLPRIDVPAGLSANGLLMRIAGLRL